MRQETDSLGVMGIPDGMLYGSNTLRALDNFPVSDRVLGQETQLVRALAEIKKSCALAKNKSTARNLPGMGRLQRVRNGSSCRKQLLMEQARVNLDADELLGQEGAGFERFNIACPRSTLKAVLDRIKTAINNRS